MSELTTPRPWRAKHNTHTINHLIYGADGTELGEMYGTADDPDVAYLIRAVNAHETMHAALTALVLRREWIAADTTGELQTILLSLCEQAEAALALADGEDHPSGRFWWVGVGSD